MSNREECYLYLHIGTHKTGTSAIQNYLKLNKKILRKQGYLYIQAKRKEYYERVKTGEGYAVTSAQYKKYQKLKSLYNHKKKCVIISNETFSHVKNIEEIRRFLDDTKIKIICYLRRQDYFLESYYNQTVKNGIFFRDISEFNPSYGLDYYTFINRWASVFGKENIIVRPYEKGQLKNQNSIDDFLEILSIRHTNGFRTFYENPNPRLSPETLCYMRHFNAIAANKKIARLIRDPLMQYSFQKAKTSTGSIFYNQSILTPQQRLEIIQRYDSSNRRVAKEFLNREDGILFYESLPEAAPHNMPAKCMTDQSLAEITDYLLKKKRKQFLKVITRILPENADPFAVSSQQQLLKILFDKRF